MKGYRYRITVERLENAADAPIEQNPLTFEAVNHDELLGLVQRVRQRGDFDHDTTASLLIGLKLFSGVVLLHRQDPLFAPLLPHLREFMDRLKKRPGRK